MILAICKNCKKEFYHYPCEIGNYCSISCAHAGRVWGVPWNKGKKLPELSGINHPRFGKHLSKATKEKLRKANLGKHPSVESLIKKREKMLLLYKNGFNPVLGKHWKHPKEFGIAISKRLKGKKSPCWKGGIMRNKHGNSRNVNWRKAVFERDNYTCKKCGIKSSPGIQVILNAHHIEPWSKNKNLRYKINNGITLCINCHKKIHFPNSITLK